MLIGRIRISGNMLIPPLILIYFLMVIVYILSGNITYPSTLSDEKVFPVLLFVMGSKIYLILLLNLNEDLAKPSSVLAFASYVVLLFGSAYIALVTWLNYLYSGEINIAYELNLSL